MTTITTPAVERRLPPPLHYTLHSAALTAKRFSFLIFSVGMPLILYVGLHPDVRHRRRRQRNQLGRMIMISMAAYGSLGAAMGGGAQLALERAPAGSGS